MLPFDGRVSEIGSISNGQLVDATSLTGGIYRRMSLVASLLARFGGVAGGWWLGGAWRLATSSIFERWWLHNWDCSLEMGFLDVPENSEFTGHKLHPIK